MNIKGGNFKYQLIFFLLVVFLYSSRTASASVINEKIYASSGDGLIHTSYNPNYGEGTDWESIRNEKINLKIECDTTGNTGVGIGATLNNVGVWSGLIKSIFPFDTSEIPDNAVIKNANIHIFTLYKVNNGNYTDFDWNVYGAHPELTSILTKADFLNIDSVPLSSSKDFENTASDGGENVFDLNPLGTNFINKEGITSFGIRSSFYDVLNNEPLWQSYAGAFVKVIFSEYPDVSKRPYLEITYEVPEEEVLEPIVLIPGILGSWEVNGVLEVDPMMNTYDDLLEALEASGYEEGVNLFTFPYEWRHSNRATALLLAQKIEEVKNIASSSKVDIVAHSMGGLVAREYLSDSNNLDNVDQLIFLATPHRGAPFAFLTWEAGEFGKGFEAMVKTRLFDQEAEEHNYNSIFEYIRGEQIVSVQELLPIFHYLRDDDGLRFYPTLYPRNTFLERLNENDILSNLAKIDVLNLVGLKDVGDYDTLNIIRVDNNCEENIWEHGCPHGEEDLEISNGDGTVPERSNYFEFDPDLIFDTRSIVPSTHSKIVSDSQTIVIKELTGTTPTEIIDNSLPNLKMILFRLFSPVDMRIVNSGGEILGKDGALDVMDINNSYYSGQKSMAEFASIMYPETDNFNIMLEGMADGEYRLVVSLIDEEKAQDKEFKGIIKNGQIVNFSFYFDNDSLTMNELVPLDSTAPQIVISSPTEGGSYGVDEVLFLNYEVSDDFSGVSETKVYLDEAGFTLSSIDLSGLSLGAHTLKIESLDKVGNRAERLVSFEIVSVKTGFEKIIQDLEDLNEAGEIRNRPVYRILSKSLEHLEDKYEQMLLEKKPLKRYLLSRYIELQLNIIKGELKIYLHKKWVSGNAYTQLVDDISNILKELR